MRCMVLIGMVISQISMYKGFLLDISAFDILGDYICLRCIYNVIQIFYLEYILIQL